MHIPLAYLAVVLVWSTTPLAIVWSGETIHPVLAAWARMALAALLGWLLLRVLRVPLLWRGAALRGYCYALIGVYGALCLSYIAAREVPSGLMSVLFGLSPILSALFAQWLADEPPMPLYRWFACALALGGLASIFVGDVAIRADMLAGVSMMLVAVMLHSYSAVMVKKTASPAHPLAQTVGTLILSQPFFAVTWLLMQYARAALGFGFSLGGTLPGPVRLTAGFCQLLPCVASPHGQHSGTGNPDYPGVRAAARARAE